MAAEGVGAVVVSIEGRPLGIVTDRDLAVRVMARGRSPKDVRLGDIMSGTPIYLSEARGLDEYIGYMREMAVRRIMVVDAEGQLIGLIALDDLLVLLTDQLHALTDVVRKAIEPPRRKPEPSLLDEPDDDL